MLGRISFFKHYWPLLLLACCGSAQQCKNSLPNPFIGTTGAGYGGGQLSPAAQVPFGALRLGPDTTMGIADLNWRHCSGYNYVDVNIRGFSHTRLQGAGLDDLGNFGVMPTTRGRDEDKREASSWYSAYNKSSETASPGHYSVYLTEPEVQVDLLAVSKFAGLHIYRWTSVDETVPIGRGLVFDVCHAASEHLSNSPDSCKSASLVYNADNTQFNASVGFKGSLSGDREGGLEMFLVAKLSTAGRGYRQPVAKRFTCIETRCAHRIEDSSVSTTAGILYSHIDLVTGVHSAELRVAISFISLDQAMINFKDAFQDNDVSDLVAQTDDVWCEELSRITLNISDASEERMIYTALYRTLLTPTQYTEVGGAYMGMDHLVHQISGDVIAPENQWYSDLSLWDTFRSQMPWLLFTRPDVSIGVLRSMVEMTKQRSAIPKWPLASSEGNCMIGKHGLASFAEAILSGYGEYLDIAAIEPVVVSESTDPNNGARKDLDHYLKYGYVTLESAENAASLTLSYAFDDYASSVIEKYVGNDETAALSLSRSTNYRNLWSPDMQIMCPRKADGSMACPKDTTTSSWTYYTEGDAEHWRWFVPHDVEGLLALFPSHAEYESTLLNFFEKHVPFHDKFGEAAPNPYYWPGNEVVLLTPYFFNWANCTYTQYWSRRAIDMHFSENPNGIPGNDDLGTMSSFVLFSSLGFFPQAGTTRFLVGSPRINGGTVQIKPLSGEPTPMALIFIVYDNSPVNVYVARLLIDGVEVKKPFVDRSELLGDGSSKQKTIEFYMSATPKSGLCSAY